MRIILLKDIQKVGEKYEVKEVADGFARNFLIPKGLAKKATPQALKWLEREKEIEFKKAEEELKKIQEQASAIEGYELIIPVKIGEKGQFFASINKGKILEKLKEEGFKIKEHQIELENPIKELGEYPIKIKFDHNLEANIKVIVTEEKP